MGNNSQGLGREEKMVFSQRSLVPQDKTTKISRNNMRMQVGSYRGRKLRKTHNTASAAPETVSLGMRDESYMTLQTQGFPEARHL